jgi:hypothetical protein
MKFLLTINLVLSLLFFTSTDAQFSSEFNASGKRLGLGLDMFHQIDKQKKWSIYSHNLVACHYNGNTMAFLTFNKLSYTFNSGIGFSVNLVGNIHSFYPGVGLHYDRKMNHISIFVLTTYTLDNNCYNETFLIFGYKYPVAKKLKLVSQNEFYTSLRKWSHNVSVEKLKLGLEFHKTQTGFFNESVQNGGKFNLKTINFGWYLKQSF